MNHGKIPVKTRAKLLVEALLSKHTLREAVLVEILDQMINKTKGKHRDTKSSKN